MMPPLNFSYLPSQQLLKLNIFQNNFSSHIIEAINSWVSAQSILGRRKCQLLLIYEAPSSFQVLQMTVAIEKQYTFCPLQCIALIFFSPHIIKEFLLLSIQCSQWKIILLNNKNIKLCKSGWCHHMLDS